MNTDKKSRVRIQNKYDTEANWLKAVNFVPLKGETIYYAPDANHAHPRTKVGDGVTPVNDLPFEADELIQKGLTQGSIVVGGNRSTAGAKGFYIRAMGISSVMVVTSEEKPAEFNEDGSISDYVNQWMTDPWAGDFYEEHYDPDFTGLEGLEAGDLITIFNGYHYAHCLTVAAVSGNIIDFTGDLPFEAIQIYDNNGNRKRLWDADQLLYVPAKPEVGFVLKWIEDGKEHHVFSDATVFGNDNKASAENAFVAGYDNVAIDDYATIFGRNNIGGYGNLMGGGWNNITGKHSLIGGTHHIAISPLSSYNIIGGKSNTVDSSYSLIGGTGNTDHGTYQNFMVGENNTISSGRYVAMFGANNISSKDNTFTVGQKNKNHSKLSVIFNYNNTIEDGPGELHFVAGRDNVIKAGELNFVIGKGNTNEAGGKNFVSGQGNKIKSSYSIIGGANNIDYGAYQNFIMGQLNEITSGSKTAVFGENNKVAGDHKLIGGRWVSDAADLLFAVGNGAKNATSNAIAVHSDGRVTLGANPVDPMDAVTKQYLEDNSDLAPTFSGNFKKVNGVVDLADSITVANLITSKNEIKANGTLRSWTGLRIGADGNVDIGIQNSFNIGVGQNIDISGAKKTLAIGDNLTATLHTSNQLIIGKYNEPSDYAAIIVGNGEITGDDSMFIDESRCFTLESSPTIISFNGHKYTEIHISVENYYEVTDPQDPEYNGGYIPKPFSIEWDKSSSKWKITTKDYPYVDQITVTGRQNSPTIQFSTEHCSLFSDVTYAYTCRWEERKNSFTVSPSGRVEAEVISTGDLNSNRVFTTDLRVNEGALVDGAIRSYTGLGIGSIGDGETTGVRIGNQDAFNIGVGSNIDMSKATKSIAVGDNLTVCGKGQFVLAENYYGQLEDIQGRYNIVHGDTSNCQVTGNYNAVLCSGGNNKIRTQHNLVVGAGHTVDGVLHETGEANLLVGVSHSINGANYSGYIGRGLVSTGSNQLIVGTYNNPEEDGIFIVGKGIGNETNDYYVRSSDCPQYNPGSSDRITIIFPTNNKGDYKYTFEKTYGGPEWTELEYGTIRWDGSNWIFDHPGDYSYLGDALVITNTEFTVFLDANRDSAAYTVHEIISSKNNALIIKRSGATIINGDITAHKANLYSTTVDGTFTALGAANMSRINIADDRGTNNVSRENIVVGYNNTTVRGNGGDGATHIRDSILVGRGLQGSGYYQMVLGQYNDATNDVIDAPLIIGWGNSDTDRKTVFTVKNDGEVVADKYTAKKIQIGYLEQDPNVAKEFYRYGTEIGHGSITLFGGYSHTTFEQGLSGTYIREGDVYIESDVQFESDSKLILCKDPDIELEAATKHYVDAAIAAMKQEILNELRAATPEEMQEILATMI